MLLQLPRHLQEFVEREVAAGHFASKAEVIADALERLAFGAPETVTVAEAVAESLARVERGETVKYTEDFLARSARRARENCVAATRSAMTSRTRLGFAPNARRDIDDIEQMGRTEAPGIRGCTR